LFVQQSHSFSNFKSSSTTFWIIKIFNIFFFQLELKHKQKILNVLQYLPSATAITPTTIALIILKKLNKLNKTININTYANYLKKTKMEEPSSHSSKGIFLKFKNTRKIQVQTMERRGLKEHMYSLHRGPLPHYDP